MNLNLRLNLNPTHPSHPAPFPRALLTLLIILIPASFLLDNQVIHWVSTHPDPSIHRLSQWFTHWGDFPPILALLLLLLLIAWRLKRTAAVRLLLLMLACACAGGLIANILRLLTGRARPNAPVHPGWYGLIHHGHWIAGSYAYSSFPSAHTAVAIAAVVPLWRLLRPPWRLLIAPPATLLALCVAASRILLNAHHLSDVVTSIVIAILTASLICSRFGQSRRHEV